MYIYYILIFIFIFIFIFILYFNYNYNPKINSINSIKLNDFITNKEYLYLYNIINKYYKNPLIEPSIKFKNGVQYVNRYSIPIFDINYNRKLIKKILNTIIKYLKLNENIKHLIFKLINKKKIRRNSSSLLDLIIGLDYSNEENPKLKFYIDYNKVIECLIINIKTNKIEYKYYKEISMDIFIKYNKFSTYNIENISHVYLASNNKKISVKNDKEYHIILKNPIKYNIFDVYVISIKPNEKTIYIR